MSAHELLSEDVKQMIEAEHFVELAMQLWAEVNQYRPLVGGDADKEFWKIGESLGAVARRIVQFKHVYWDANVRWIRSGDAESAFKGFKYWLHRFPEDNRWQEHVDHAKIIADEKQKQKRVDIKEA